MESVSLPSGQLARRGLGVTLADNRPVLELDGKTILLPKNKQLRPKNEELEWRMQHLLLRNYRCE
jgi:hypothetical protein